MESVSDVASLVFEAFDDHYDGVEFTVEDVQTVVDEFDPLNFTGQALRECVAMQVWAEQQPSPVFPPELKQRIDLPPHIDEDSLAFLNARYTDGVRHYLRDLKQTVFPPEVELAIDDAVEDGVTGFEGVTMTDYALVDVIFQFQYYLYVVLPVSTPFAVARADPAGKDVLFDDGACVYYEADRPWNLEQVFDKRMSPLSVGAVLDVMERAAVIRASESYNAEELTERVEDSETTTLFAIQPQAIPPLHDLP